MSGEVLLNGKSLKEFKVSELKVACKERNLPIGGTKNTLIKRLKAAIELENLQKAARSSPAGGSLPNSEIADDSNENDFIKQYMENQRKLLQSSTSSRFSSTSEADSEEEATSHKAGTVVSPLVGRRGRRATRDSRHSNDGEPEQISEEAESNKAQVMVKPVPDEERPAKEEEVNLKPQQLGDVDVDKSVDDVSDGIAPVSMEAQVDVTKESNTQLQPQNETEKKDHVDASDAVSSAVDTSVIVDNTKGERQDDSEEKATQQDTDITSNTVESTQIEMKDDSRKESAQQDVDNSANSVETTAPKTGCDLKEESTTPDVEVQDKQPEHMEVESIENNNDKPQNVISGDVEALDQKTHITQPEASEQHTDEAAAKDELQKDNIEECQEKPLSPKHAKKEEIITEETVVDVDEIVNQEEELDYDENDGMSQEKSEVTGCKDTNDDDEQESTGRRIHLRRKEKSSESGHKKAPDQHRTTRKRSAEEQEEEDKAPGDKKSRKRIKRQGAENPEKEDVVQQVRQEDASSNDVHMVEDKPEEKIEQKPIEEEKPLVPLRRINLSRREPDLAKAQKRKWGGRSASTENVNISSDLIKGLIDIKSEEIEKAINEQEEIGEEPGELVEEEEEHEEVDEIIDIVMEESPAGSPADNKPHAQSKDGEEDGEIVEEEEVVVEEFVDADSGGEEKPHPATHHDNRKVVTGKSTRKVEQKSDMKNRRVVSQSDQNGSHKEAEKNHEQKRESKKKSLKTSVSVNRSGPKEPTPPPEARDVSPSRYPTSTIIHVRNLVRPFTLPQLKNFLGKLGKVQEDSFWIDKIKSHCLVTYETEDDAMNARRCLHGINWPSSNPKSLSVDFCDAERANSIKDIGSDRPIPPLIGDWKKSAKESAVKDHKEKIPEAEVKRKDDEHSKRDDRERDRDRHGRGEPARHRETDTSPRREDHRRDERRKSPERGRRDDERRRKEERKAPLREWDRDKLDQEAEHRRLMRNQDREKRSPRREERRERKQKEVPKVEEQPAKLLDDLFRKTKATPCIYWLPLTNEQAAQRIKEREQRREARNKIRREMEEEDKSKARQEPERRAAARSARSPGTRQMANRPNRDEANDRRPPRRDQSDRPSNRSKERPSPPRRKNRSQEIKLGKAADKESDSSSSSGSSSGSDSDSESGSSSDSSSSDK